MRLFIRRCFAFIVLMTATLAGLTRGQPSSDEEEKRLAALIDQLGAPAFAKREAASTALRSLGEKTIPALQRAAADHENLETRRRAEALIDAILPKARKSASTNLSLVLIEPGLFDMGSVMGERDRRLDEPRHGVRITKPFYLGAYEVTQEEFEKVMKRNPSWFAETGEGKAKVAAMDTKRFPVEGVSWLDAVRFCNALSKRDGFAAYYILAEKRDENKLPRVHVTIAGGSGYRLPTEAEWEYACRANSVHPFHFGLRNTGREANLKPSPGAGGYGGGPSWQARNCPIPVGSFAPNAWGLYDMHGNVSEWCWDWYAQDYYGNSPGMNPTGPKTGTHRVHRGGSWLLAEGSCRSAARAFQDPTNGAYNVGFRVARNP